MEHSAHCKVEPCKRVNDKGVVTFFGSAAWRKRNCGPFLTNDSYFYTHTHTQIVLTHTFFHKSYWLRTSQTKSCLRISCKQWRTDRRVCYLFSLRNLNVLLHCKPYFITRKEREILIVMYEYVVFNCGYRLDHENQWTEIWGKIA